jgi:hypothetical protein
MGKNCECEDQGYIYDVLWNLKLEVDLGIG